MSLNFKNIENEVINKIILSLCSDNTEIYLVGGYIRDLILDRICYDRDYAIKGEKALEFAGCINQDIYDDLNRRDYTVNAIAYRINGNKSGLIDPFNGRTDIENK